MTFTLQLNLGDFFMKLRVQRLNFDSQRSVKLERIERRYHYAMHIHQFAELVFPLSGELKVTMLDREEILKPGQVALIFPFQPHGYMSSEKNKLSIFVFSPALLPDLFSALNGRIGHRAVFTPDKSTYEIFKEIVEKHSFDFFQIKGAFYIMMKDYLSKIELSGGSKGADISSKIIEYIEEHMKEDISVKNIAESLGYSYNYVSTKIKKIFGVNLSSLIAAIRIDKAIDLMTKTDKSCLEISNICGFGSQQSFNRQFKDLIGRTPSDYRSDFAIVETDDVIKYF